MANTPRLAPIGFSPQPGCLGNRFNGVTLFGSLTTLESMALRASKTGENTPEKDYFYTRCNILYDRGWITLRYRF